VAWLAVQRNGPQAGSMRASSVVVQPSRHIILRQQQSVAMLCARFLSVKRRTGVPGCPDWPTFDRSRARCQTHSRFTSCDAYPTASRGQALLAASNCLHRCAAAVHLMMKAILARQRFGLCTAYFPFAFSAPQGSKKALPSARNPTKV